MIRDDGSVVKLNENLPVGKIRLVVLRAHQLLCSLSTFCDTHLFVGGKEPHQVGHPPIGPGFSATA